MKKFNWNTPFVSQVKKELTSIVSAIKNNHFIDYEIPYEYLNIGLIESINLQNIDLINIFIKKGATIDSSVLIKVIEVDDFELFIHFFKIGGVDNDNHALYYSIKNEKYDFAKFLIDKLEDVNIEYEPNYRDKKPILFFAIENRRHEIVRYLLKKGANPMIPERQENTWKWDSDKNHYITIQVPCLSDLVNKIVDFEMLKLLVENGIAINHFSFKVFFEKYDYSIHILVFFIEHGYDISNFFDNYNFGFDIYHMSGNLTTQNELFIPNAPIESLKFILENSKFLGKYDIKILYYAARANRLDLIKILVEMGANVKGMRGKSLAEIFHDGAPEYKWWTIDVSDDESISELYYIRNELEDCKWWHIPRNLKGKQKISEDINKKIERLADELLKSSDNIIINYLLKHGASRNWQQYFPEVVKDMLLLENSVSEAKDRGRSILNEEMARDGWNAAFENFSDENYSDYI